MLLPLVSISSTKFVNSKWASRDLLKCPCSDCNRSSIRWMKAKWDKDNTWRLILWAKIWLSIAKGANWFVIWVWSLKPRAHTNEFVGPITSKTNNLLANILTRHPSCHKHHLIITLDRQSTPTPSAICYTLNSVVSHLWQPKCTWYYGVL